MVLRAPSKADTSNTGAVRGARQYYFINLIQRMRHDVLRLSGKLSIDLQTKVGWYSYRIPQDWEPVLLVSVFEGARRTISPLQVSPFGEI